MAWQGKIAIGFLTAIFLFLARSPAEAAQADWKRDWEQTLAAAKKEGQVNVYIYRYERLLQDFKREFPGINVVAVTGRGNEMTSRIIAERRGGKFIADVYSGGSNSLFNTLYKGKALDPLKPLLILPEVIDVSKWWGNEHRYADPEGKHIFAFIGSPSNAQLSYNTKMVDPKEFKSYWDVSQVEGEDRFPRPARHRLGRDYAVLLLQPGDRAGVLEKILRRHGHYLRQELAADDQLAGAG